MSRTRFFERGDEDENASRHLIRELIRAMWEQGFAEEDILDILARLGMASDTATFALEEVMEKVEVAGMEDRRSILRQEVEKVLWEWTRDLESRAGGNLAGVEERLFALEKELNLLRRTVEKVCLDQE